MVLMSALLMGAAATEADQKVARMAALYEQVCLKAFPDDNAVDRTMANLGARQLSSEDVKITLRDDPGRAWELKDGSATVWLELPPYHACSVRWNSPEIGKMQDYKAIARRYQRKIGGYSAMTPFDADYGDVHAHAVGEQRRLSDGGMESMMIFDQHITNEARRAAGETGVSVRFVHQIASRGAK